MKNKLISVLTWLTLGVAAVAGSSALAGRHSVTMTEEALSCEDWSFNDSRCSAYLAPSTGKAAYGEPSGTVMRSETEIPLSCEDWSFNNPQCPAYLARTTGKAAYGEPSGKMTGSETEIPLSCEDWSFNNPQCPAYLR
jgi:hypothetical protein